MSDTIILELPEEIAIRARDEAKRSHRRLEDVVLGWLGRVAAERPIEDLTDAEIMAMYRRGLVRKARATTEAVERGLRPSLNQ